MSLIIPSEPDSLYFTIKNLWNGDPCGDESRHAEVWLTKKQSGLNIRVHAPLLDGARIPSAPRDSRFDGLWEYDVIEVFLVGDDGTYTEIELGAGGHFLVLSFGGVRIRSNDWADREFDHRNSSATPGTWQSQILIPWDVLPKNITKLNAFAIAGGTHLAMSPVPGPEPDFHQPDVFPEVTV